MMRKRWIVMLVMLLCVSWLLPGKALADQEPVLHRAEDCLTGEVSYYYYDDQGNMVRRIDQAGRCEVHSYYADGVLKSTVLYAENKPIRLSRYDTHGNVQMVKSWYEDGAVRYQNYANTYDEQDRLQQVRYTDSMAVDQEAMWILTYVYNEDDAGYMTEFHAYYQETDESPYRTRFTYYDAEGRLLGDEDYYLGLGEGSVVSNFYDEDGNLAYETKMRFDQNGQTNVETTYTYHYDADGRLVKKEALAITTSESFQEEDSQTRTETTLYKYQYDEAGRMIREEYYDESGEQMGYEAWTYDRYGNLLESNFAGRPLEAYEYAPLSEVLWKNHK